MNPILRWKPTEADGHHAASHQAPLEAILHLLGWYLLEAIMEARLEAIKHQPGSHWNPSEAMLESIRSHWKPSWKPFGAILDANCTH
jgi:hypothetical protein